MALFHSSKLKYMDCTSVVWKLRRKSLIFTISGVTLLTSVQRLVCNYIVPINTVVFENCLFSISKVLPISLQMVLHVKSLKILGVF